MGKGVFWDRRSILSCIALPNSSFDLIVASCFSKPKLKISVDMIFALSQMSFRTLAVTSSGFLVEDREDVGVRCL